MNYHNIKHDDILNGEGLRVTLFVSGCSHKCKDCQNSQTWNPESGIEFDINAKEEIFKQLGEDYISGITFSGGDPLYESNLSDVLSLIKEIKSNYPNKTIWLYSGYTWEEIINNYYNEWETDSLIGYLSNTNLLRHNIIQLCDVFVDGEFKKELLDINYHWAGSTNQRVIDVKESLQRGEVVLYE